MLNRQGYEVTTYRVDGEYEDGRHPKSVDFTTSLLEDLKRRDFTINAMAYNSREGLVDAFGGIEDLENRVIRCVGSAVNRFTGGCASDLKSSPVFRRSWISGLRTRLMRRFPSLPLI